jgi:hypothetical protein
MILDSESWPRKYEVKIEEIQKVPQCSLAQQGLRGETSNAAKQTSIYQHGNCIERHKLLVSKALHSQGIVRDSRISLALLQAWRCCRWAV